MIKHILTLAAFALLLNGCSEQGNVTISVEKQEDPKFQDCLFNFKVENQTNSNIELLEIDYKYDAENGRPLIISNVPAGSTMRFSVDKTPIQMIHRGHQSCATTKIDFLDFKSCKIGSSEEEACFERVKLVDDTISSTPDTTETSEE